MVAPLALVGDMTGAPSRWAGSWAAEAARCDARTRAPALRNFLPGPVATPWAGASTAGRRCTQNGLFGGSCGLTPRRIASQRRTQVPHSATGASRKDALWGAASRKSAFCVWADPKGAFCMRAVVQSASFREGPRAECTFP